MLPERFGKELFHFQTEFLLFLPNQQFTRQYQPISAKIIRKNLQPYPPPRGL